MNFFAVLCPGVSFVNKYASIPQIMMDDISVTFLMDGSNGLIDLQCGKIEKGLEITLVNYKLKV